MLGKKWGAFFPADKNEKLALLKFTLGKSQLLGWSPFRTFKPDCRLRHDEQNETYNDHVFDSVLVISIDCIA